MICHYSQVTAQGRPPSTRSQLRDDRRAQPRKRAESPGALWNMARLGVEDEERHAHRQEGLAQGLQGLPQTSVRPPLPCEDTVPGQPTLHLGCPGPQVPMRPHGALVPSWRGPWQKPSANDHSGNASTADVLSDEQPFMK